MNQVKLNHMLRVSLMWILLLAFPILTIAKGKVYVVVGDEVGQGNSSDTLRVQQVWDEKKKSYKFWVWLKTDSLVDAQTLWQPGAMKLKNRPSGDISLEHIGLPANKTLLKGQKVGFEIEFKNVRFPGTYIGTQEVLIRDKSGKKDLDTVGVPIRFSLDRIPPVKLSSPSFTLKTQNSSIGGNWLFFLPQELRRETFAIRVRNEGGFGTTSILDDYEVDPWGTFNTLQYEEGSIEKITAADSLLEIPGGKTAQLKFKIHRNRFEPGEYHLRLVLRAKHDQLKEEYIPLETDITLQVRSGPILAFLTLLIGILMGKVVSGIGKPDMKIKLDLEKKSVGLKKKARSLKVEATRNYFRGEISNLEKAIGKATAESKDGLEMRINNLHGILNLLQDLQDWDIKVNRFADVEETQDFKDNYRRVKDGIHTHIQGGKLKEAYDEFESIHPEFRLKQLNVLTRLGEYLRYLEEVGQNEELRITEEIVKRFSDEIRSQMKLAAAWNITESELEENLVNYPLQDKISFTELLNQFLRVDSFADTLDVGPATMDEIQVEASGLKEELLKNGFSLQGRQKLVLKINEWMKKYKSTKRLSDAEGTAVASPGIDYPADRFTEDAELREIIFEDRPIQEEMGRIWRIAAGILKAISYAAPSETRLYLWIKPVLLSLAVILTVLVGMDSLYNKNAVFGENGLIDYLPLLFYGLATDVVIGNLSKMKLK